MSQDDFIFRRMQENNPANEAVPEPESFSGPSHVRNVYFLPLGGDGVFLNYAYLVSCTHTPDFTVLTLGFTTHLIVLKGVLLKPLFLDLMGHVPKVIVATDERYNATIDDKRPVVNEIAIQPD